MHTKRIISALGAALIAGAILAASVAPSASAATVASDSAVGNSVGATTPTQSATSPSTSLDAPVNGLSVASPEDGGEAGSSTASPSPSDAPADSELPNISPHAVPDGAVTVKSDWLGLTGTASHDGQIIVTDQNGRQIGQTVQVVNSQWSFLIPWTLQSGVYTFTVRLVVNGDTFASTSVTVFWTQLIVASGPSSPITGSTATLTGTGHNDAEIAVLEDGVVLAKSGVTDGAWSIPLTNITVGTHNYTVQHLSAGAASYNYVTVVRVAGAGAGLVVSSPADPSVGYEAGSSFTFTGSAPATAKTVTVRNAQGALIAVVPVDPATETWSWTRANMGTSIWKLTFIAAEGAADEQRVALGAFAPKKEAPVDRPVIFTNPSDPSVGYAANTAFTFRGTATPGATVSLENAQGTVIASNLPVDKDGNWSWTRANMGTSIWKITAIAISANGTQRATLGAFAPAAPQADRPLAFTNPVDPAAGYVANTAFTFRGTAPQGTSVSLRNVTGLVVANDLAVDKDGNWSWTRANMGTSIWKLTAVARFADGSEKTVTLAPFAPAK